MLLPIRRILAVVAAAGFLGVVVAAPVNRYDVASPKLKPRDSVALHGRGAHSAVEQKAGAPLCHVQAGSRLGKLKRAFWLLGRTEKCRPLSPSPEPLKPRPGENPPDEIVIEGKPLKLGKRLGRGAFGVAYAVDWPGHGAAVAKTYHKTTHPRAIRKEIEQLKAVKQFLATGKVGDDTWVIMPLAPGVPLLKTRLYKEARKKSMEACKEFMTQARRIIATEEIRIRDQSDPHMLHSDVKLDNVNFTEDDNKLEAHLFDYGNASQDDDATVASRAQYYSQRGFTDAQFCPPE